VVYPADIAGSGGCGPGKEKCREAQNHRCDRGCSAKSRGGCSSGLRRSGLRARKQLKGPERRGGEVSSSRPDDDRAWLQVGAGALKHCVASGRIPEATHMLEAIRGRKQRLNTAMLAVQPDQLTHRCCDPDDYTANSPSCREPIRSAGCLHPGKRVQLPYPLAPSTRIRGALDCLARNGRYIARAPSTRPLAAAGRIALYPGSGRFYAIRTRDGRTPRRREGVQNVRGNVVRMALSRAARASASPAKRVVKTMLLADRLAGAGLGRTGSVGCERLTGNRFSLEALRAFRTAVADR
jgi:hypothetical protein